MDIRQDTKPLPRYLLCGSGVAHEFRSFVATQVYVDLFHTIVTASERDYCKVNRSEHFVNEHRILSGLLKQTMHISLTIPLKDG